MSLPFSRRIAQAALLLGAAAAPLVGAGAAHAAAPQKAGVGGLTAVDGTELGSTLDGASQKATTLATQGGTQTVGSAVPAAGRVVGTAGRTATPVARQSTTQVTDATGRVTGAAAESLPVAGALPDTGALPTVDRLPVRSLPF